MDNNTLPQNNLLGLIGYPLTHSFSKKYFTDKFIKEGLTQWAYELFPIPNISELSPLIQAHESLVGLNVTIPYKSAVFPYLDAIHPEAEIIGAVNCIGIHAQEGKKILKGYNTDIYGFEKSLYPLLDRQHDAALILGSGGASKAVQYVLTKLGINFIIVSRSSEKGLKYEEINQEQIKHHKLIINTSPLGMYPEINNCPNIPYQFLSAEHLCMDLIYNPEETLFLNKAKAHGAITKNGLEMLYLQAEKAWEYFTDTE